MVPGGILVLIVPLVLLALVFLLVRSNRRQP